MEDFDSNVKLSFEDYMKTEIDNGFIDEEGMPLKCHYCECKDLRRKTSFTKSIGDA